MVHNETMTEDAQMKIRLPLALKAHIEAAARASNRSLNGEIAYRLETSFGFRSPGAQPSRRALKGASDDGSIKMAKSETRIRMACVHDGDVDSQEPVKLTLSDVSEDIIDYIAGKVAARLQRDDDG